MHLISGANLALPLDVLAAIRADESWQDRFVFPLDHELTRDMGTQIETPFLRRLDEEKEELVRAVLIHAAPFIYMVALGLYEQAVIVEASKRLGITLEGGPPESYALRGLSVPKDANYASGLGLLPKRIEGAALLRRIARTASWTPAWRLPFAYLAPQALAVSHNSLMLAEARRTTIRMPFVHASNVVSDWVGTTIPTKLTAALEDRMAQLAELFASLPGLSPDTVAVLKGLIFEGIRPAIERSARATLAIRSLTTLPRHIWSGTGGFFPVRAIAQEVTRRGGTASGFDHGGTTAMVDEAFGQTLLEYTVLSRFTVPTEGLVPSMAGIQDRFGTMFNQAVTAGGSGDPSFLKTAYTPHVAGKIRRAVYVMAPFIGPRQRARPRHHDVLKLDWQLRVVRGLTALPNLELLCQPHPEGVVPGRNHPVHKIAGTSSRRFEEVAEWADVIISDMVMSTTLWRAVCLEIPIILIDLDMSRFNPHMKALVQQRLRIVPTQYDDRNRPIVDVQQIQEAMVAPLTEDERAAMIAFRRLLGGSDRMAA